MARTDLQKDLERILGSNNVYFQPPENVRLKYPCIVYELDSIPIEYANNNPYKIDTTYSVTVITKDCDTDIHLNIITGIPGARFNSHSTSDGLHHFYMTVTDRYSNKEN